MSTSTRFPGTARQLARATPRRTSSPCRLSRPPPTLPASTCSSPATGRRTHFFFILCRLMNAQGCYEPCCCARHCPSSRARRRPGSHPCHRTPLSFHFTFKITQFSTLQLLKPRYHFSASATSDVFFERAPYRNTPHTSSLGQVSPAHVTRFFGMAHVGNTAKAKWLVRIIMPFYHILILFCATFVPFYAIFSMLSMPFRFQRLPKRHFSPFPPTRPTAPLHRKRPPSAPLRAESGLLRTTRCSRPSFSATLAPASSRTRQSAQSGGTAGAAMAGRRQDTFAVFAKKVRFYICYISILI